MHIHHKIKPENMNFKGILVEIATIIFAVLLALGAESFWEHHKTMEMIEISVEKINKEVSKNLFEFVRTDTSAKLKLKSLTEMESEINNKVPLSSVTGRFQGYDGANMNISTWKRVLNDKISNYFPADYMDASYEIYQVYDAIELIKSHLLQFIFSDLFLNKDKETEAYQISIIYYKELLRHCDDAIKNHTEFLKKYDAENFQHIMSKCDSIRASIK